MAVRSLAAEQLQLFLLLLSSCALASAFGTADELDKAYPCGCFGQMTADGEHLWTCTGDGDLTQLHVCFVRAPEMAPHGLTLRNISMTVLTVGSVRFVSKLESLSVHECRFKDLNLEGASNLTVLNLAFNQLQAVDKAWFTPLANLKLLNLSHNLLTTLPADLTHDLKALDTVDLSHNHFLKLSVSWFSVASPLLHLNVSNNKLERVAASDDEAAALFGEHLTALRSLDLSRNQLHSVPGLELLKKLKTVWLNQNLLSTLPPHAFSNNTALEHFYLSGNSWHCDDDFAKRRNMLLQSLTARAASHGPVVELHDVSATECASPLQLKGRNPFLFGFALCEQCSCKVVEALTVDVNCTGRGLEELPLNLPLRARMLRLANNRIKSLMLSSKGEGWDSLLMLDVHGNEISSIDQVVGTRSLRSLMALHLTNNRLSQLASHVLQHLSGHKMDDLRLSGNPWLCTCETVNFATWLQDNKKVKDVEEIRCSDGSPGALTGRTIYSLPKSDLCPQPTDWTQGLLDALSVLMAIAIIAILAKLGRDYWRQKRTGKLPTFFSFV
ncbi:protein halfway-like [Dermacentor variabilis]|uniref:protein halfway-like n=1 Tax=Dermacentor variabilis TaxID=34621 RepID=UPI003F5C3B37